MQGANGTNVQCSSFLKHSLHLSAVLATNIEIVAASFTRPIIRLVTQSAEFAKTVSGKQHLFSLLVTHNNLGPMHHGSSDELKYMCSKRKGVALLYWQNTPLEVCSFKEVGQHFCRSSRKHHLHRRISIHRFCNERGVVGFHVMYHQIVGLATVKHCGQIGFPFFALACIYGIHYRNLLIQDHIAVIAHAFGYNILAFKKVYI